MENASKALIIAGGILLALLILSTLIYVGTTMSNMADQQNQSKQLEQTAEFNRTYEAYNRSRLYGTDVISVVNRAIEYNSNLDTDESEYFINITLILTSSFDTTIQKFIRNANGTLIKEEPEKIVTNKSLPSGTYNLRKKMLSNGTEMEEKIVNFFNQDKEDTYDVDNSNNQIIETYTYSAITTFKNAIFECKGVSYDNNGRIISMTFEQKI